MQSTVQTLLFKEFREVARRMEDCLFCRIVRDQEPAHKIWADAQFLAFLSTYPISNGHTLLITKQHFEYLFELREPLYTSIFQVARRLARPLRAATRAVRIGMAVEGFKERHLHLHLVPINEAGGLDPRRRTKVTAEDLFRTAEEIRRRIIQEDKRMRRGRA